ncbi:MAG: UvrB/UvrC motif-containing protein [Christensenellaceae bacterium]|nr:UvrB/UvrC motif-containing protein [Christensenellaceae bacterium]
MLCDVCEKNEATIHTIQYINGTTSEQHLCPDCAAKLQSEFGMLGKISNNDFIKNFFTVKHSAEKRCPNCGYSFEDFKKSGFLGCPDCYQAFRQEILPMLRRVHGHTKHIGAVPEKADERAKARHEIEELKRRLAEAISEENFEEAAKLRDQINAKKEVSENGTLA